MKDMNDGVVWTARGDSSLSGTYRGKEEVGTLWAKLGEKGLKTEPHDFIADGDKVVVLTTVTLDGQSDEAADVLTYDEEGKLIAFDQLGDPKIVNSLYPR
jgi:ketosteroid isomerase-like protein